MEKKISNAFTYMFKDEDWRYKLFILAGLAFPGIYVAYQTENLKQIITSKSGDLIPILTAMLLLVIFTAVCTFLFEGYCCKSTQKIIYANEKTKEKELLPKWENDFWGYSKIGVSFSVGVFLLGIVASIGSILIIPLILFLFAYIALKTLFCVDFKMGSFFAWKKAHKLMSGNWSHYFSVVLCSCGVYIVLGIIAYICSKSLILVFVAAFVQAYVYLVLAYLRGTLFPVPPEEFFSLD